MSENSIARFKSLQFAKRVVKLYQYLNTTHKEFVMSKQILRSGTSIGANISEAIYGSSRKDFAAKLEIAQKETAETLYWLELLNSTGYIPERLYDSLRSDCCEIMAILISTIKKCQDK